MSNKLGREKSHITLHTATQFLVYDFLSHLQSGWILFLND